MSLILGKYKNKRKLGKGAYGDVLLVEDQTGKLMAMKMVNKKIIQKDPYLQQYLEGQKEVMMSVKDRHVVELYAFEEDENYKYFVCEYCDGGDLLNYQAVQPNKVFSLKLATQIMSQVIEGLEILHSRNYLHRDIKPANILLKKTNVQGKYLFKLADFGFAKKSSDVGGTVLGTEHYMSPQVFSNEIYSYEVDMWAFGVLFYFMLNMELPFRINPHATLQSKRQDLLNQAKNFSYSQLVKKSKKKILTNCTNDVQDLFRRMFDPNPLKRINFAEIRQHPLFREYFPVIETQSKILYKQRKLSRYDTFVQQKQSGIYKPKNINKPVQNTQVYQSFDNIIPGVHMTKVDTSEQKAILQAELDRIQFLLETSKDLSVELNFIEQAQVIALRYNLLKYYVVLMRDFCYSLKPEILEKKYPGFKWREFSKTSDFNTIKGLAKQKLDTAEIDVSQTYDQCRSFAYQLKNTNPQLEASLESEVTSKDLDGAFKTSYRASTSLIYSIVRQKFSNGNRYVYLTALMVMCHSFNHLIHLSNQELTQLFPEFVQQKNKQGKQIEFIELKSWMSTASKQKIKNVIKAILQNFF